jgi:hypothetical protein
VKLVGFACIERLGVYQRAIDNLFKYPSWHDEAWATVLQM